MAGSEALIRLVFVVILLLIVILLCIQMERDYLDIIQTFGV